APAVLVNNFEYVESVTPESVDGLINRLRELPGKTMAPGPMPRLPDPHHHDERQDSPQATGSLGQAATKTAAEAGSTERKP
ncbi:MAG: hypothetical protein ABR567_16000, partial [Myxococcales bacterium]